MNSENVLSIPLNKTLEEIERRSKITRRDIIETVASTIFTGFFWMLYNLIDSYHNRIGALTTLTTIPLISFVFLSYTRIQTHKKILANISTVPTPTLELTPQVIKIPFIARYIHYEDIALLEHTKANIVTLSWDKIKSFESCRPPEDMLGFGKSQRAFRIGFETLDNNQRLSYIYIDGELMKQHEQSIVDYVRQHIPVQEKALKL